MDMLVIIVHQMLSTMTPIDTHHVIFNSIHRVKVYKDIMVMGETKDSTSITVTPSTCPMVELVYTYIYTILYYYDINVRPGDVY